MLETLKKALNKSIKIHLAGGGFVNIDTLIDVSESNNVYHLQDRHGNTEHIPKDKFIGFFEPVSYNYSFKSRKYIDSDKFKDLS